MNQITLSLSIGTTGDLKVTATWNPETKKVKIESEIDLTTFQFVTKALTPEPASPNNASTES